MSGPSIESHKIWIEQCAATEPIRERFGLESALDYLIGEKVFSFATAAERDPDFAAELRIHRRNPAALYRRRNSYLRGPSGAHQVRGAQSAGREDR